mgnify:CR=1 FL=1
MQHVPALSRYEVPAPHVLALALTTPSAPPSPLGDLVTLGGDNIQTLDGDNIETL